MATTDSQARDFAKQALRGQVDKGGAPLVAHALRMAQQFRSAHIRVVALLHDVLEDSTATLEGTTLTGPDGTVLELTSIQARALVALTRKPSEMYMAYIDRIKKAGGIAVMVKLSDVNDHLDQSATLPPSLRIRYEKASQRLTT